MERHEAAALLFWVVTAFFFLIKVAWNLTIPYELARLGIAARQGAPRRGISPMLWVEWVLLVMLLLLAALVKEDLWIGKMRNVAVWGAAAIIGSYVHLIAMGVIAGWVASRWKRNDG